MHNTYCIQSNMGWKIRNSVISVQMVLIWMLKTCTFISQHSFPMLVLVISPVKIWIKTNPLTLCGLKNKGNCDLNVLQTRVTWFLGLGVCFFFLSLCGINTEGSDENALLAWGIKNLIHLSGTMTPKEQLGALNPWLHRSESQRRAVFPWSAHWFNRWVAWDTFSHLYL